jgi:Zn-dependent protease
MAEKSPLSPPSSPSGAEPGIHLFTIAGIRIVIDYSWFIIFLLVAVSLSAGYLPQQHPGASTAGYWAAGLIATAAFFFSILFHELAHSFMALRSGISIPSITLFLFGGVSRLSEEPKDPKTDLRIAIVGPFSSFVLAGLFWVAGRELGPSLHPLARAVLEYLAFINLALGIFNLAPGFPLDGGRVLRAIVWWRTGSVDRATRIVSDLGKGFALTLIFAGAYVILQGALLGGIWLIFIGMFLRGSAARGYEQMVLQRALESARVSEVMILDPVTLSPELPLGDVVDHYFLRYGYHGFPVVEGGSVVGLLSVADIAGLPQSERASRLVRDVMRPLDASSVISKDASLLEALERLSPPGLGRLVVLEEGRLRGFITKTGLIRLLELRWVLGR